MTPLISVIVPVLNSEKYLPECLKSITDQTYKNFEVILVLGKGNDNSEQICQKWCEKDNRFRIIPQLKPCVGYARNTGIEASAGEYIAFCDSDDCITNDFLSSYIDKIVKNNADIVETQFTVCNESLVPIYTYDRNKYGKILGHCFLEYTSAPSVWKYCVRKEIIIKNNILFPESNFGEDACIYSLLFSYCKSIEYIDHPTYLYRKVPTSLVNASQRAMDRLESLPEMIIFMSQQFSASNYFKEYWLSILFQLELHSLSVISNSPSNQTTNTTKLADLLMATFKVHFTLFNIKVVSWGGEIVSSISTIINNPDVNNATIYNRYFFELLDTTFNIHVSNIFKSVSPNLFIFDLISEANYLSTYHNDLGIYVKNWKLGFNVLMKILQDHSSHMVFMLLENRLKNPEFHTINSILKMLYDDIKSNYPNIICIPCPPSCLLHSEDGNLLNTYQLKQVLDQMHLIYSPEINQVEIKGGLGNQIYQYVFGKYLEQLTGKNVFFHTGFFNYVKTMEGGTKREFSLHNFFPNLNTTSGMISCSNIVKEENCIFESSEIGSTFFRGYWQNIKYFTAVKDVILNNYTFSQDLLSEDSKYYASIIENSHSVSMHIRRDDYLSHDNKDLFEQLTLNYYNSAIKKIIDLYGKNISIYIFSDDIGYAQGTVPYLVAEATVIPQHKDFEDFYLMTLTRHHIIANSTYSLWAALLSKHDNGITIAPKNWFKGQTEKNRYPNNWITL